MNKIFRNALAGSAATVVMIVALPSAAQAQLIGPCPSIIMPPPCIVVDPKKLLDIMRTHAAEIEKVRTTVSTIQQAKAATSGVIADLDRLRSFDLRLPDINMSVGPLLSRSGTSFDQLALTAGNQLFAGQQATAQDSMKTKAVRQLTAKDANVEAFAFAAKENNETTKSGESFAALSSRVTASADLRTDWEVNSQIKLELLNVRNQQSQLLASFLKMQSANNVLSMPASLVKGFFPGKVASDGRVIPAGTDQSEKLRRLEAIYGEIHGLLGSLSVVQMTESMQDTLRGVISDYDATVVRKSAADQALQNGATNWSNETNNGRTGQQQIMARILAGLNDIDVTMAARRALPPEALINDFAVRNINYLDMLANEVDPRQFIGNWTDPLKAENTRKMIDALMDRKVKNGGIDGYVDGDNGTREQVEQFVYNYNDTRLEEAWKKVYADEARASLIEMQGMINEENVLQKMNVDEGSVKAKMIALIAEANSIGQQIAGGTDQGTTAQAAAVLTRLDILVKDGSALPAVAILPTDHFDPPLPTSPIYDEDGRYRPTIAPVTVPDSPGLTPVTPTLPVAPSNPVIDPVEGLEPIEDMRDTRPPNQYEARMPDPR